MLTRQDDIPEGLVFALEKNPKVLGVSTALTDEILKAAVESVKEVPKADLVSAEDRIVAFVDLLGTKSLMQRVKDKEQAQETYNTLTAIGQLFEDCVEADLANVPDKMCRIISDSYVISVPNDPESFYALIVSIAKFQRGCLLGYKELARGGVAQGKMVVGGKMMIGTAFVDAHLLEAHIASYPRVVINSDIDITKMLRSAPISLDKDGMYYVSYLSGSEVTELKKARSIIESKKQEKSDPKNLHERQKWEWAQTYVDQVLNGNEYCCACKKEVCV
jgi:hypothetical protein